MKQMIRGQRLKLTELTPSLQFQVGLEIAAPGATIFDFGCFGLDPDGRLSDDRYFIFYNQKASPCESLAALGPRDGDREVFQVDLSQLPSTIRKLAFTVAIDGEGAMGQIAQGHLRLLAGGVEVARYAFAGADFRDERSLIIGELYLKDVWRLAAVGQGFKGDLAALVRHYGGEVAEEADAPPAAPPVPPAPPAEPVVIYVERGRLRETINEALPGATLVLQPGEYEGPITIHKPLTIEGKLSTIWSRSGPTLVALHPDVCLRDLNLEVTNLEEQSGEEADVALKVAAVTAAQLHNVSVRGRVVGLDDESGRWLLPATLNLGTIAPRQVNEFIVSLTVPVACRLDTRIAGLFIKPATLAPGTHDVTLTVEDVMPDTLLLGRIEVRSARLVRAIEVKGRTVEGDGVEPRRGVRLLG